MSSTQALELAATVIGILVGIGGGITVWVKLNNQIAVLQDRSDHERDDAARDVQDATDRDSRDTDRDDLVDELRRQIQYQAQQIEALQREVREERAAREADLRRAAREIDDLKDQIGSLNTRLTLARQAQARREDNT